MTENKIHRVSGDSLRGISSNIKILSIVPEKKEDGSPFFTMTDSKQIDWSSPLAANEKPMVTVHHCFYSFVITCEVLKDSFLPIDVSSTGNFFSQLGLKMMYLVDDDDKGEWRRSRGSKCGKLSSMDCKKYSAGETARIVVNVNITKDSDIKSVKLENDYITSEILKIILVQ